MILVDTSVWIEHFKKNDPRLTNLLEENSVLVHPFVVGELACGNLGNRNEILTLLRNLPEITTVSDEEVLYFINRQKLFGKGLGYIDVHLIASCTIENVRLYTFDKKLNQVAEKLQLI